MMIEEPLFTWIIFIARLCLAVVFLVSGIHKAVYYRQANTEFLQAGIPWVPIALPLTIVLHLAGSLGLIMGVYVQESALALAVFTLLATVKVHNFWRMSGSRRLDQSRIALAHLAIIGGLLLLAAINPGQLSM